MTRPDVAAATLIAGLTLIMAAAPDAPRLVPTRDVDVTYEMVAVGRTLTQRMRWDLADGRMRVDPPDPGVYLVTDYKAHRVTIVRERDRSLATAPAPAAALPGSAPTSATPYQRRGTDTVAGLACTEWATVDVDGHPVSACVTDDGVMLRVTSGGRAIVTARSVAYGAQDKAAFDIPAGYRPIAPERAPGGQAPAPG